MRGTVHGFESEGVRLTGHGEHVLAVMLPVTRSLPQRRAVQRRGHDLAEAPPPVLTLTGRGSACISS